MTKFRVHFECKFKRGSKTVEAENFADAKKKALPLIKNGVYCENRCNSCKLNIGK